MGSPLPLTSVLPSRPCSRARGCHLAPGLGLKPQVLKPCNTGNPSQKGGSRFSRDAPPVWVSVWRHGPVLGWQHLRAARAPQWRAPAPFQALGLKGCPGVGELGGAVLRAGNQRGLWTPPQWGWAEGLRCRRRAAGGCLGLRLPTWLQRRVSVGRGGDVGAAPRGPWALLATPPCQVGAQHPGDLPAVAGTAVVGACWRGLGLARGQEQDPTRGRVGRERPDPQEEGQEEALEARRDRPTRGSPGTPAQA